MSENFVWGQQGQVERQRVVAMTASDAQQLVTAIVSDVSRAVVERNSVEALEAYKQAVRLETEVVRLRELLAQRDAEVTGLRSHIDRLGAFISSMQPTSAPAYSTAVPARQPLAYSEFPQLIQVPAQAPSNHHGSEG